MSDYLVSQGKITQIHHELVQFLAYLPAVDKKRSLERGLMRAAVLQQIHHRIIETDPAGNTRIFIDKKGRHWYARNLHEWIRWDFSFMEAVTLRKVMKQLRDAGLLLMVAESKFKPLEAKYQRVAVAINYRHLRRLIRLSREFAALADSLFFGSSLDQGVDPTDHRQKEGLWEKPDQGVDPTDHRLVPSGLDHDHSTDDITTRSDHQSGQPSQPQSPKTGSEELLRNGDDPLKNFDPSLSVWADKCMDKLVAFGMEVEIAFKFSRLRHPTMIDAWINYVASRRSKIKSPAAYIFKGLEGNYLPGVKRSTATPIAQVAQKLERKMR